MPKKKKTGVGQAGGVDWMAGLGPDYDKAYEKGLRKAAERLTDTVAFGGTDTPRGYNKTYWKTGKDRDGDEILILHFGTPAAAVLDILNSPKKWTLDCIEFIQVLRWCAQYHALGQEAFNKLGGINSFKLSYHETTGLRGRQLYLRSRKRDAFDCVDAMTNRKTPSGVILSTTAQEDEFLKSVPIGSRVMWSDSHPDAADTDFENENTLKIGPDEYVAHPFGILSAQELREEMATPEDEDEDDVDEAKRDAYIRRNLFIKEIEWYARS
ncbi:MAG: hypothetical protein EOO70_06170 [Myxococcaceae bacterium]|nr:MAG: hypothetical protein EOO70_06170 [Myxococcaceae bacterium]